MKTTLQASETALSVDPMAAILLTSCVYVRSPFVKLNDPVDRVNLTIHALRHWLDFEEGNSFIICDGSGYDFTDDCNKNFPSKDIECLHFINDVESVEKFGKGYGEGEIVNFALANSRYLKEEKYFVKCTAKLWVRNFGFISRTLRGPFQCDFLFDDNSFVKNPTPSHIDTRFYIADKEFYLANLAKTYKKVRDREGYYLEHAFCDDILRSGYDVSSLILLVPAVIDGASGTSGIIHVSNKYPPPGVYLRHFNKLIALRLRRFLKKNGIFGSY